jgi:hypothetical protein
MLADTWIDSERIPTKTTLQDFVQGIASYSPRAFTESDMAVFAALPDPFVAYRGCGVRHRAGHSWTLAEETARWFAKPHERLYRAAETTILSRSITKADVLFYTNQRKEQEIVLRRPY